MYKKKIKLKTYRFINSNSFVEMIRSLLDKYYASPSYNMKIIVNECEIVTDSIEELYEELLKNNVYKFELELVDGKKKLTMIYQTFEQTKCTSSIEIEEESKLRLLDRETQIVECLDGYKRKVNRRSMGYLIFVSPILTALSVGGIYYNLFTMSLLDRTFNITDAVLTVILFYSLFMFVTYFLLIYSPIFKVNKKISKIDKFLILCRNNKETFILSMFFLVLSIIATIIINIIMI